MLWSSQDIQKITKGECLKTFDIQDVVTDHREVLPGSLFVALKGETMDGHAFVEDAFKKGACGALVSNNYISNHDCLIKVENTYDAFIKMAEASRARFKGTVLGITGSVGKTSVKEGLVFLLSKQVKTYGSKKSYNNHVGVPLTLINTPKDAEYVVLEMGMNHTGEMSALSLLAKPNGALITTIAPAHLGNFESIEGIAHAKSEIFEGLTHNGFAILNEDNEYIPILKEKALNQNVQKVFTFGMKSGDAYVLKIDGTTIHASVLGEETSFQLNCDGLHWIYNTLPLLLFVKILGLDLQKAAQDVRLLAPAPGRGEVFEVPFNQGHITVIDDSYNANPESMKSGLSTLKTKNGRKIAVLGDMRELGIQSKSYHLALLDNILDAGVDRVFLCGEFMFHLYDTLPEVLKGIWAETSQDLITPLQDFVQKGDVVLVKGSNSLKMNLVVNTLKDLKRGA